MSASEPPAARGRPSAERHAAATQLEWPVGQAAAAWTESPPTGGTRSAGEPSLALGRYRLQRRLGAGAFGTVWMAHDERLDREVAVKILPRERVLEGRFEREAHASARLAHPGIVTLYEAAVDDEGAYLVSELVRGATLRALLEQRLLSDRAILAMGISLCDALAHAHAHGVVHRDVKPSNILIPDRPSSSAHPAKLTDFGVARVVGGDSLTRAGEAIGTAAYMAPEQAEGREAGAPADLYALAVVIYEALSGINPVSVGPGGVRARGVAAYLPPLRRRRRELPREVGRSIDLALRPRPRERGTLSELRLALAVSLDAVADRPGLVAGPWPDRSAHLPPPLEPPPAPAPAPAPAPPPAPPPAPAPAPPPAGTDPSPPADRPATDPDLPRPRWPARGLAAGIAALTVAWLASHVLDPSPLAPAALAILAAVLVLAFPRVGWLALTGALVVASAAQGRPGGSLVLALAALLPVMLLPRTGVAWPLAATAPALGLLAAATAATTTAAAAAATTAAPAPVLGLLGLPGIWPALAGRARRAWCRAALGLTGWLWLMLAAALAGADLYARRPAGTPVPSVWTGSLTVTFDDVLIPLVHSGVLAGAPVWALAAVVLPWLLGRRPLWIQALLVSGWAAATAAGTQLAIAAIHGPGTVITPATTAIAALASALAAIAPALLGAWGKRAVRIGARRRGPRRQLP